MTLSGFARLGTVQGAGPLGLSGLLRHSIKAWVYSGALRHVTAYMMIVYYTILCSNISKPMMVYLGTSLRHYGFGLFEGLEFMVSGSWDCSIWFQLACGRGILALRGFGPLGLCVCV